MLLDFEGSVNSLMQILASEAFKAKTSEDQIPVWLYDIQLTWSNIFTQKKSYFEEIPNALEKDTLVKNK